MKHEMKTEVRDCLKKGYQGQMWKSEERLLVCSCGAEIVLGDFSEAALLHKVDVLWNERMIDLDAKQ